MPFRIENQVLIRYQEEEGITEVIVPDGVTEIGISAFALNKNIESIVLPESVKIIGAYAFRDCPNFHRLTVGNGIEEVSDDAFYFCFHLREIIYCGFWIPLPPFGGAKRAKKVFQVLTGKNLEPFGLDRSYYHMTLWFKFAVSPENQEILKYIREHFREMYEFPIDCGYTEIMKKILEQKDIVNQYNIDELIQYAIRRQKYEIQLMLTDYKYQHFEFSDISDKLKL